MLEVVEGLIRSIFYCWDQEAKGRGGMKGILSFFWVGGRHLKSDRGPYIVKK